MRFTIALLAGLLVATTAQAQQFGQPTYNRVKLEGASIQSLMAAGWEWRQVLAEAVNHIHFLTRKSELVMCVDAYTVRNITCYKLEPIQG